MSKRIKFCYACSEIPEKTFLKMINPRITVNEVLGIISKYQKKNYISLFYEGSQIDKEDIIENYIKSDQDSIFYASTTEEPPTDEFMQKLFSAKQEKSIANIPKKELLNPSTENPPQTNFLPSIKPPANILPPTKPEVVPPANILPPTKPEVVPSKDDTNSQHDNDDRFRIPYIFDPYSYRNPPQKATFKFYFTGSTKEHFKKGISIELNTSMNHEQCLKKLQDELSQNGVNINNKTLIIFLPGGIPFTKGRIIDIYCKDGIEVKTVIYGVLVKKISDLNKKIYEVCNACDEYHRSLLSPHCDSTEHGLSDMACLLGYFNRNYSKSDFLLKAFAYKIHFAPLLTSLKKIIQNEGIIARDVVTVCSVLFTYFRFIVPSSINDNKLLEHIFPLCNLFNKEIYKEIGRIPLSSCDEKYPSITSCITRLNEKLNLDKFCYIWSEDFGSEFKYDDNDDDIDFLQAKETDDFDSFLPVAPLSLRKVFKCSVVKGKDRDYLYLMPSLSKSIKCQNMINIIDPIKGITESIDLETFAKEQIDENKNDTTKLINRNLVKQIVMFNLDESKSMINGNDDDLIISTVIQYMSIFVNNNYRYHNPTIQGLVSFNNTIKLKCPLTPFITEFENKAFSKIQPKNTPKLWDSIIFSCNEISKFRNDNTGEDIFKEAMSRIIVISNGNDLNSDAKPEDVVKELISKKIIVDCIIIDNNVNEDNFKMLCAVCHATGGCVFRPANIEEGISFIERNVFLDLDDRKLYDKPLLPNDRKTIPNHLRNEQITEDFMNQAKDNSESDKEIIDRKILYGNSNPQLATPLHSVSKNSNLVIPIHRTRRILKELNHVCQVIDPNNEYFDPDIMVYNFHENLDLWKVFIKGPEGTPYENKWWYLLVYFPIAYPYEPPTFRFISIPYHLNVSDDGMICLNILDKGYMKSKHVIQIIQEIKELFFFPSVDTPLRIDAYELFMNNQNEYERLAKESANSNAKDDYSEFYSNSKIINDVPSNFKLEQVFEAPIYKISQISGKTIKEENLIFSSSSVYYDKNELKRLLETDKNPICVITGKVLTDKIEDIEDFEDI